MRVLLTFAFVVAAGGCATATDIVRTAQQVGAVAQTTGVAPVNAYWDTTPSDLSGDIGATIVFICPPNGTRHSVWGTDVYTSDSSVCTAGVHMGLITFERGGTVTIQVRDGQRTYSGTSRNGVESRVYGQWGRSFVFVR